MAPTNTFHASFVPLVPLKKGEACSLKRHFRGCVREVVGYLESTLRTFPNVERFVFARVVTITKHCNKFSKNREPYKQDMVKKSLAFLRQKQVVSARLWRTVGGVRREGYIVYAHESLTCLTKHGCLFVGWNIDPAQVDDAVSTPDFTSTSDTLKRMRNAVRNHRSNTLSDTHTNTLTDTHSDTLSKPEIEDSGYPLRYPTDAVETRESSADKTQSQKVPPQFSESAGVPSRGIRVSQSTVIKEEPSKPSVTVCFSNEQLTDRQKAKPQLCEELKTVTVREFFRDVSDDELIPKLSAGMIASGTVDAWVGEYWKRDKPSVERATKDQVIRVCRDVISSQNDRVISRMSNLGDMMARIMRAVMEATGLKVPSPWLRTIQKLEVDHGPLLSGTPLPGKGTLGKVFQFQLEQAIRYGGIDVEPNVELLDRFDLVFRQKPETNFRECWQLAELLLKDSPDSSVLVTLRNYWWQRDAMPDKAASAPWEPLHLRGGA